MLYQGNKFIVIICLIIFFASCSKYKKYDVKEIEKIRTNCMNESQALLGNEYWDIYNSAVDTIESWINNKIGNFAYWNSLINYQLDSILCVNKEKNKVRMNILLPYVGKKGVQDDIEYFYGAKIKDQWFFFCGPTLVLPREYYQKDIHTPLSLEKLKQIAAFNIYKRYLYKNKQGNWEINDRFFDRVVPSSNLKVGNKIKTEEEYIKFMVEVNWSSDVNATIRKYQEE